MILSDVRSDLAFGNITVDAERRARRPSYVRKFVRFTLLLEFWKSLFACYVARLSQLTGDGKHMAFSQVSASANVFLSRHEANVYSEFRGVLYQLTNLPWCNLIKLLVKSTHQRLVDSIE